LEARIKKTRSSQSVADPAKEVGYGAARTGNPASRRESNRLIKQMVSSEAEALTRTLIDLALSGNAKCLQICLDQILPQHEPIDFKLPPINSVAGITAAMAAVITAVNDGKLAPATAGQLVHLIEGYAKAVAAYDVAARLDALEAEIGRRKS
jgi:hypothetical protein